MPETQSLAERVSLLEEEVRRLRIQIGHQSAARGECSVGEIDEDERVTVDFLDLIFQSKL